MESTWTQKKLSVQLRDFNDLIKIFDRSLVNKFVSYMNSKETDFDNNNIRLLTHKQVCHRSTWTRGLAALASNL